MAKILAAVIVLGACGFPSLPQLSRTPESLVLDGFGRARSRSPATPSCTCDSTSGGSRRGPTPRRQRIFRFSSVSVLLIR